MLCGTSGAAKPLTRPEKCFNPKGWALCSHVDLPNEHGPQFLASVSPLPGLLNSGFWGGGTAAPCLQGPWGFLCSYPPPELTSSRGHEALREFALFSSR